MPDEKGEVSADEEAIPKTPLHAHAEGREEDVQGEIGGGTGEDQDADTAENTGGATSGGPGGDAVGEDDPSKVESDD
ncbi:MAG: hypothetical protein ACHQJ5_08505 [Vicinamibacteria bacterium]